MGMGSSVQGRNSFSASYSRMGCQLIEAASMGDIDTLRALIQEGVDINYRDRCGRTALHLACAEGHTNVIEYLLDHGADYEAKDRWGHEAMYEAMNQGKEGATKILRNHGAKIQDSLKGELTSKWFYCASKNDLVGIAKLIQQGVDVNSSDYLGQTALHIAVRNGSRAVVEYLIKKKIEVYLKDQSDQSALDIALRKGDFQIQSALLAAGAEVCTGQHSQGTKKASESPAKLCTSKRGAFHTGEIQELARYRPQTLPNPPLRALPRGPNMTP